MLSSPFHAFHNFTVNIEDLGDTIFKRQESIIHLIQCECPDEQKKCNHILARKVTSPYTDQRKKELKESEPALPMVDVVQLIRHFQNHLTGVMQTQRKVFEYAQCACPNKKECLRAKATSNAGGWFKNVDENGGKLVDKVKAGNKEVDEIQEDEGFKKLNKDVRELTVLNEKLIDETDAKKTGDEVDENNIEAIDTKQVKINKRSILERNFENTQDDFISKESVIKKRSADSLNYYQNKGFFDEFLSWFSQIFHTIPLPHGFNGTFPNGTNIFYNGTYPNGTHYYYGTLPDGAVYEGGEFHNGNANGYFLTSHKNDSTGNSNSFSSSSSSSYSSSSGTSFGK